VPDLRTKTVSTLCCGGPQRTVQGLRTTRQPDVPLLCPLEVSPMCCVLHWSKQSGPDWRAFGCCLSGGVAGIWFFEEDKKTIWDMREAGVPVKRIAKHLGRRNSSLRKFIADAGGRRPTARERSELRLSLAEREEISRGLAGGSSIRRIAEEIGRSP